jgi:hypothetical protein
MIVNKDVIEHGPYKSVTVMGRADAIKPGICDANDLSHSWATGPTLTVDPPNTTPNSVNSGKEQRYVTGYWQDARAGTRKGTEVIQIYFCAKTKSKRQRPVLRFFKRRIRRLANSSTRPAQDTPWISTAFPR